MAGRPLQATEVYRGGSTARSLNLETRTVELSLSDDEDSLQLEFSMDSKGGGVTIVHLTVGAPDFGTILETMVGVDRQAAMVAMADELATQLARQPEYDASTAASARNAVLRAAHEKYLAAPADNDETERFIEKQIEKLISEIVEGEQDTKE